MVRPFLRLLVVLALLAVPARATWSIVAVDTETGEVAVASATCIPGFNLRRWVAVIVPGRGAAAAQALVDSNTFNKRRIRQGMERDLRPTQILHSLSGFDGNHHRRQYGIVDMVHKPLTYTGTNVGRANHGVTGVRGTLKYAVQGNLLTSHRVVTAAERALVETPGDLGQKMMAAMEAARRLGGDGRCSCGFPADSCGAPPPGFEKSAHIGFVIVSRVGDVDVPCSLAQGCAIGTYYMNLNVVGAIDDPDPVLQLHDQYAAWRASWMGRPDHVLSEVTPERRALVADGADRVRVSLQLRDLDGVPVAGGGAVLALETVDGAPGLATPGPVEDLGGGRYAFDLVAGTARGSERWRVRVDDGQGEVTLVQTVELRLE